MIKSLLESGEDQPDEIELKTEKQSNDASFEAVAEPKFVEVNEAEDLLEISGTAFDASTVSEKPQSVHEEILAASIAETTGEMEHFSAPQYNPPEAADTETAGETISFELPAETKTEDAPLQNTGETLFQTSEPPESFVETARKSGLAYAAAITLFASVVFMLIIGWFADLILGSSPWGIVGGIVLGAAIGFFQFFRLTSQIFRGEK